MFRGHENVGDPAQGHRGILGPRRECAMGEGDLLCLMPCEDEDGSASEAACSREPTLTPG